MIAEMKVGVHSGGCVQLPWSHLLHNAEQNNDFHDLNTRLIIVECAVINPSENLYAALRFGVREWCAGPTRWQLGTLTCAGGVSQFEFPTVGGIFPTYDISIVKLLNYVGSRDIVRLVFECILLVLFFSYYVREGMTMYQSRPQSVRSVMVFAIAPLTNGWVGPVAQKLLREQYATIKLPYLTLCANPGALGVCVEATMSSCLTDHVCRGFIVKRRVKRRELELTCVLWFSCALSPWLLSVVRGGVECQALQILQSDWQDRVLGLRRDHLALVLRHVQHIGMLSPPSCGWASSLTRAHRGVVQDVLLFFNFVACTVLHIIHLYKARQVEWSAVTNETLFVNVCVALLHRQSQLRITPDLGCVCHVINHRQVQLGRNHRDEGVPVWLPVASRMCQSAGLPSGIA